MMFASGLIPKQSKSLYELLLSATLAWSCILVLLFLVAEMFFFVSVNFILTTAASKPIGLYLIRLLFIPLTTPLKFLTVVVMFGFEGLLLSIYFILLSSVVRFFQCFNKRSYE